MAYSGKSADVRPADRVSSIDKKVDEQVSVLAKEVMEDYLGGRGWHQNSKMQTLLLRLRQCGWNELMTEAALKGVKSFTKTKTAKDHRAVFAFYHQMLTHGKDKALKVVNTEKHCGRLFKCTEKNTERSTKVELGQYFVDWVEMFDGATECFVRTRPTLDMRCT